MNDGTSDFKTSLAQDVLSATRKRIEEKVMSLECPVHGQKPRWKSVRTTGTTADLQFHCCCQELAARVKETLQ